jgi:hypothetical protein
MKQVSDKRIRYQVKGLLLPINPGSKAPIWLEVDGEQILPLFTSIEKFDKAAKWGGFSFATKNVILNPQNFYNCVLMLRKKFPFHVVVDPHITKEGNTQFQLLLFEEEENGQKS